jgi:hypothetical protein
MAYTLNQAARLRDDTIADLRCRLDAEADERRRLTALLTDQRHQSARATIVVGGDARRRDVPCTRVAPRIEEWLITF